MGRAWQISSDPMRSVLLTTDADSAPIPTWIDANLRAIEAGADIVGGRIAGNEAEEASLELVFSDAQTERRAMRTLSIVSPQLIDPLPYDPWPRHSDHTGASLAVRAECLRRGRRDASFTVSRGPRLRKPRPRLWVPPAAFPRCSRQGIDTVRRSCLGRYGGLHKRMGRRRKERQPTFGREPDIRRRKTAEAAQVSPSRSFFAD